MGSSEFSVPALNSLLKNNYNVLSVYSQPPVKSKRGQKINISPLHEFAERNNLPVRNPKDLNSSNEYNFLKDQSADLAIVVAYGQIIPKDLLCATRLGFINIHASLLPRWRGAAPIQRAIMSKDKKIGVTIMKIEEKLDSGPVISFRELQLNSDKTCGEIEKELSEIGASLLIESIKKIESDKVKFTAQEDSDATYAKKINKKEAKINWNYNADYVKAQIHALNPNPGAWFKYGKERFKVWRVKKSSLSGKPSTVLDENLTVGCKSDSIQILEIKRKGKNKQLSKDFLLGKKINKGSILT